MTRCIGLYSTKNNFKNGLSKVMKQVKPEIIVWVYYLKGTSKIQTDLTRDKGWDCFLKESDKLKWINLISFDDTLPSVTM